ncbi:ferric reduction oxidase 7, chloroplastic-like [Syzygium oleosum]|uniref:ferric reduction oxidase 7, chloroplastic-like n=1 Tax=Syzygium oleosum TaxID=219896 RepID=UPI0011D1DDE9|nr:ferric reduction oxidase 7, chloroplastic-like [Syzygium oleosum]XP_056160847.1 ferric reduction oxidase 7, chloroplastic-like [Syzygium oleosum]
MAKKHSAHEPLLLDLTDVEKPPRFAPPAFVKWVLNIAMWLSFIFWVAIIFASPSESAEKLTRNWTRAASGSVYGLTGSIFLLYSGPILAVAFLAIASLIIGGEKELQLKKTGKYPRFRLRTFPILVDGPFGVVSAAEFIGICFFVVFVLWAVYGYTLQNLNLLSELQVPPDLKGIVMLELSGLRFGSIGLYCLAFLFLPITRGSVLLSIIDIPFEQATRYHVWLGHLTMFVFTLHGLFYLIAWGLQGRLLHEILEWRDYGVANLPGVISLSAGLLMWVTSLSPVRKKQFELFFYTHQLYIVFVIFMALHVGDFIFSIAAGGIFLFVIDRFLRFCQSRRTVDVISTTCLPCGTVELVFSKPANLRYNALSFVFLQIRELSWLQWHPFSVSSSPLAGKNHVSVLIKVLGEWTAKLKSNVLDISSAEGEKELPNQSCSKITASVEGPYGHELPYHLTYENLILVAGGIGISPFLAILSDILHLTKEGKPCVPKNILVIWAIKKSDELPILFTLDAESICPHFSEKLNLQVCVYVTRESDPPLEEGKFYKGISSSMSPPSKGSCMSVLVGTGNRVWSGVYVILSVVGFAILMALLDIFYINPMNIVSWWYKGLLFVGCMFSSMIIFGGPVIYLWRVWEKRILDVEESADARKDEALQHSASVYITQENLVPKDRAVARRMYYGTRPNFEEIFTSESECWGNVDIGVIVCGPETLQSSVARECRSQNLRRGSLRPVFHFNSHSFDL